MAMKARKRRRYRRPVDPIEAESAALRIRAARVGIHFEGDRLTAWLPQARCTPDERDRAQKLADAAGITLSEHVRRRAVADPHAIVVAE
jgi:hypothetical protein